METAPKLYVANGENISLKFDNNIAQNYVGPIYLD